jgi:hypothetical protein
LENVVGGSDDARIQWIISVSAERHGAHGPTKHAEDGVGGKGWQGDNRKWPVGKIPANPVIAQKYYSDGVTDRGAKRFCHFREGNLSIRFRFRADRAPGQR